MGSIAERPASGETAQMNVVLPTLMNVDEFLSWSQRQPQGRYELQDGRVIMQQSQNVAHLRVKKRLLKLLDLEIERAGIPYYSTPDGATVRITPRTAFEPDALVAPLPMPDDTALEIPNSIIVCEVLSPSSIKRDLSEKVAGYFQVPSFEHYMVADPEDTAIIWHRRASNGALEAPLVLKVGAL